ncbi:MAG: 7-cyano-7-deazaguanine/7-aminomethyl-7-deazaguanine transporter [Chlamydiales bacterium]|nr:7-cyano-7-deazaguanine/7-aminomethyl-7-deazaguanine transporter [Chlamydiales bacterium]NCF71290.1 7-cyano-7-deazaguanine/7-aminomethyl-7-deazaguanine transporter [Chlamydiales bacterium]
MRTPFLSLFSQVNKGLLYILISFHILIIAASNYLVQLPFSLWGVHSNWGVFTFPFIFLLTDLTVRVLGERYAKKVVFLAMFPTMIVSYVVSVVFLDGKYQGFLALASFDFHIARIAFASFLAYLSGQLLDITIFTKLRRLKKWWVAPSISTLIGDMLDTLIFFFLAFYASSDSFLANHWPGIAAVDCIFKLVISFLFFLPAYGVFIGPLEQLIKHQHPSASQSS